MTRIRETVIWLVVIFASIISRCSRNESRDSPLTVAIQIANSTEDKQERGSLLQGIVNYYASNREYDKALDMLETIGGTLMKDTGLYRLTVACSIDSQYERAAEIAELISDAHYKALALASIAMAYARNGQYPQATTFAERSHGVAQKVVDGLEKAQALSHVASVYILTGQIDEASTILREAVQSVELVPDTGIISSEVLVLIDLVGRFIEIRDDKEANSLLSEALNITRADEFNYSKDLRMADIAEQYAVLNQYAKAVAVANTILDIEQRGRALQSIAAQYAADGDIEKAQQLAETLEDPYCYSAVLMVMLRYYCEEGEYCQAENVANLMKDPSYQAAAMHWLAVQYVNLKKQKEAIPLLSRALQITETMDNQPSKFITMSQIAEQYANLGQTEKATQILQQLFSIVSEIEAEQTKSFVLSVIAKGYANIGDYHNALQVVKGIEVPNLAISSLLYVDTRYSEAGVQIDKKSQRILGDIKAEYSD